LPLKLDKSGGGVGETKAAYTVKTSTKPMSQNTKDWKTMKLGDILTEVQIAETMEILNAPHGKIHGEATNKLKAYYSQFREQLEAKGVLPEFLAYAVPFWIRKGLEEQDDNSNN